MVRARALTPTSAAAEAEARTRADDGGLDFLDVPAAVVCATCGDADCPGCAELDERTQASGVVAIVPWERPGLGAWGRLWGTARLATTSAESFFGALPDGEIASALRFAVIAEIVAVTGLSLVFGLALLGIAPEVLHAIWFEPTWRHAALRVTVGGVPAVALVMVGLHALHGIGLDYGARRAGGKRRGRGLRFGLYSCAWDLIALPLGALVLAVTDGPRAGLRAIPLGLTVPSRAARAYLRGVHGLDDAGTASASRTGILLAGSVLMVVCFGGFVAAVVAAALSAL